MFSVVTCYALMGSLTFWSMTEIFSRDCLSDDLTGRPMCNFPNDKH